MNTSCTVRPNPILVVTLPASLVRAARAAAKRAGMDLPDYIATAVREKLLTVAAQRRRRSNPARKAAPRATTSSDKAEI